MKVSKESKKEKVVETEPKKSVVTKTTDIVYKYCYILSTLEQRKALDLNKYKTALVKVIKEFFAERLVEINIQKDRYLLILNEPYEVRDKRRLGRLISERCKLSAYSHKVKYNNNQDLSGQLFRICKEKEL
jgi:hypothetical protein